MIFFVVRQAWANLPPDLLGSIAERLPPLDYLRFGAVCTSWAIVVRSGLYRPLPSDQQIPVLLFPEQDGFLNLPEKHWHPIARIPEMQSKWCIGSQFGWLTLVGERDLGLLNPLTGAYVSLPSQLLFSNGRWGPLSLSTLSANNHDRSFKKIVLSSPPDDLAIPYTAVAIIFFCRIEGSERLAFLKQGEDKWHVLPGSYNPTDVIYRAGKFLVIDYYGRLQALHLTGLSTAMTDIPGISYADTNKYLVDSSGDLLLVSISSVYNETVKIMKFDDELGEWIRLKSLGDNCLFLGLSHSISVSTRKNPGLKRNTVYFTDHLDAWLNCINCGEFRSGQHMRAINLEDGALDSYYPPQHLLRCPPPVWFMPSLLH